MRPIVVLLLLAAALPLLAADPDWESGIYDYDGVASVIAIGDDRYTYDVFGRLVRADVKSGQATTTDVYAYDAFGNLHKRTTTGANGTSEAPIPVEWSTNRLADATYDGVGNTLSFPGLNASYRWDAHRMMSSLTAPGRDDVFVYSATDERIGTQRSDGNWRWTFRDFGGRAIRELESSGSTWTWVEDVVYRDKQVAGSERPATAGGRRHFHNDHLGTARLITNDAGQTVSRHDFLPFGIELTSIRPENRYRFTGHERDFVGGTVVENTSTLDYMHARHYASTLGRFLTIDPGRDWNASDPQSWNLYTYVQNNPISNVDLTGKWKTPIHEYLIDKAFPGLSLGDRAMLKRASKHQDRFPAGHFSKRSHEHGLRPWYDSVEKSQAKSAAFYEKKIEQARANLADAKASEGNGTGRAEVMRGQALWQVGEALHLVTDMGSPMHKGQQIWNMEKMQESFIEHPAGEATIDQQTEDLLIQQMRSVFGTVFGEDEEHRAAGLGPWKTGKGN